MKVTMNNNSKPPARAKDSRHQFKLADRAVTRAAAAIERAVASLLAATLPLEAVAQDYVIERLADELMTRNPEAFDWLNHELRGPGSMRVANALMDWHDLWASR
jgi:hypothetical protein